MTRRYDPETDDRVVKHLFQCLMSDAQIAERLNVSVNSIPPARARLGLGRARGRQPAAKQEEEPLLSRSPGLNSPMAVAFLTFGERLKEVNGAYRLDGTPIKFSDLMREVNRARVNRGEDQMGHSSWRTP